MKILFIFLLLSVVAIAVWFYIQGMNSNSGRPVGLVKGLLSQCSSKPNCACSEYKSDKKHYIEPIQISANVPSDLPLFLKNIVKEMGGSLVLEDKNYLAFTFSSKIFNFVDDFEIRHDLNEKTLHVRSASRVGTSDFGVNIKRIELFKKIYFNHLSSSGS